MCGFIHCQTMIFLGSGHPRPLRPRCSCHSEGNEPHPIGTGCFWEDHPQCSVGVAPHQHIEKIYHHLTWLCLKMTGWWLQVVYLPLCKIWKSVGMMIFAIYGRKKLFPTTNQMMSPPVPEKHRGRWEIPNKMEVFDGTIINIKAARVPLPCLMGGYLIDHLNGDHDTYPLVFGVPYFQIHMGCNAMPRMKCWTVGWWSHSPWLHLTL